MLLELRYSQIFMQEFFSTSRNDRPPHFFLPGALPCQTWFELCQRQRVPAHRSDRFSFRQAYSKLNPRQVGQDPLFGAGCLGTMTAGAANVHHSLSGVQLLSASNLATLAKVGDHDPAATAGVRLSHTDLENIATGC